jgi:hypothetical protein
MILLNKSDIDDFPIPIMHLCFPERKGEDMTSNELHEFGIQIVIDYHLSMFNSKIISINRNLSNHYPHIVTENSIAGLLYIWVKTTIRPILPDIDFTNKNDDIKKLCLGIRAKPVFCGVYLTCACSENYGIPLCGEGYFAEFTLFRRIDLNQ